MLRDPFRKFTNYPLALMCSEADPVVAALVFDYRFRKSHEGLVIVIGIVTGVIILLLMLTGYFLCQLIALTLLSVLWLTCSLYEKVRKSIEREHARLARLLYEQCVEKLAECGL